MERIESHLEQIKNEKMQIIEKAQEKDLLLDTVTQKLENLKKSVNFFSKNSRWK
jgi:hypothetical protein